MTMRFRLMVVICLTVLFSGPLGCRRAPQGPWSEFERIGGEAHRYDRDPRGPGYRIEFCSWQSKLITDRDLQCLRIWPASEIWSLHLSETKLTDAGLEQIKAFTNLQELTLRSTNISDKGLRHLAGLKELRSLDLEDTQVMGPGLKHLESLPHLERLNLRKSKLTDEGLKHARGLKQIQSLSIDETVVTDRGLDHVAQLSGLQGLSVGPMITNAGVAKLQKLPGMRHLVLRGIRGSVAGNQGPAPPSPGPKLTDNRIRMQKLSFPSNLTQEQAIKEIRELGGTVTIDNSTREKPVTRVYLSAQDYWEDTGLLPLLDPLDNVQELCVGWLASDADMPYLGAFKDLHGLSLGLKTLQITGDSRGSSAFRAWDSPTDRSRWVSDKGVRVVAGLPKLRRLDLTGTCITDEALASLTGLTKLQVLGLRSTAISGAGLRHIRTLKELQSLGLTDTAVGDDGLDHLQSMTHLENLWLGHTLVTDAGLKKLLGLKKLDFLSLNHTAVTDAGIKELSTMKGLKELHLDYTLVTNKGLASLRRALPNTKIVAENIGDRAPRATDAEMKERSRGFP